MTEQLASEPGYPCQECEGYGTIEDITWRSFGRGLEPVGEDRDCEACEGLGIIHEELEDA